MGTNRGIVKTILLIVVAIVLLSFFGIDLREVTSRPLFQKNVQFLWGSVTSGFENYIYGPIFGKNASSTGESATSTKP